MFVQHSNKKRKNVARSRVSRFLQTVLQYESREKYRDTSMNRADTNIHAFVSPVTSSEHLKQVWADARINKRQLYRY